jgi:hypothetical protein
MERRAQAGKDKKAAAEEAPAEKAAPAVAQDRPLEPSMGDVSAALLRVKSSAQACLTEQSGQASASVTFGSDGRVQSVAVSGPGASAGGGCIKNALSQARVSAFSKPSFTISTTVRPHVRAASD